ncbi:MAG: endonuclease/exonuclease/phosphatase family protein [Gemmatimonadota bacterium]|nr:endonuclease/exonuclease/phosphatase family protein [Gemmatimonadota bacterium]
MSAERVSFGYPASEPGPARSRSHMTARSPSIALLALGTALAAFAGCGSDHPSPAPAHVVWTDGGFDDWTGVPAAASDPSGDAPRGAPVDFGAVFVQDDPRFIHLLIDLGDTVTAQGMPGSVEIVLDGDADPGTGGSYGGVEGADLAVVLSRQWDSAADARGAGAGVRRIGADGPDEIESASAVGLLVSPTHSSDRFEVRLDRLMVRDWLAKRPDLSDAAAGSEPPSETAAGTRLAGRLRHMQAGAVADETPVFAHTLATAPGEPPPLLGADAVARAPGALRVVTWNVSDGHFRDRPEAFRRVLAALDPDVILLDEVYAEATMADLERFSGDRAAGGGPSWGWWLARGGGRQRTAVGARATELRGEAGLARIDHPPGALERWLREVGDEPEFPRMAPPAVLARAEADGGLSATGAWMDAGDNSVLFVPVDLQSAGYDGSPRDRLRELQARTLNRAVAAALARRPDAGLVIGGDLNLVGSARPLDELRSGLGAGGGDLDVVRVQRLRDRSLATWRSTRAGDPFSPGRLDHVLYRASVLRVERAFVFDAADLSPAAIKQLRIRESDTRQSDHFPLVVDFAFR